MSAQTDVSNPDREQEDLQTLIARYKAAAKVWAQFSTKKQALNDQTAMNSAYDALQEAIEAEFADAIKPFLEARNRRLEEAREAVIEQRQALAERVQEETREEEQAAMAPFKAAWDALEARGYNNKQLHKLAAEE